MCSHRLRQLAAPARAEGAGFRPALHLGCIAPGYDRLNLYLDEAVDYLDTLLGAVSTLDRLFEDCL
jgi:hypothetical protein